MITIAEALRRGGDRLERAGGDAPRLQARRLLARVSGRDGVWVYQNLQESLGEREIERYDRLVDRRLSGEPLAYLIGNVDFGGRSFAVDQRVLVPRPETEELLEHAIRYAEARRAQRCPVRFILDVGTGTGVLAVSLAASLRDAFVVGIDRSWEALEVATVNVERHNVRDRLQLIQADLLDSIDVAADLIVANLPYVPGDDITGLQVEVQREPRIALDGGPDGLDLYRRFFAQCDRCLVRPGLLIAEIGDDQGEASLALVRDTVLDAATRLVVDSSGRARFITAERSDSIGVPSFD